MWLLFPPIQGCSVVEMRWSGVFFNGIVIILTCINIIYLTKKYFTFATTTNVAPYYPVRLSVPSASICFSLFSLISNFPREYNFETFEEPPFINMTFEEMFSLAPDVSSVLVSCKYRDLESNFLMEEKNATKCTQIFQVKRYRAQGYMCYRFKSYTSSLYSYNEIVNSLHQPRELYHLTLNETFSDEVVIYPFLHLKDIVNEDRSFNQEVNIEKYSLHHLKYSLYEFISLPFPYETTCLPKSKIECSHECIEQVYRKHNFSPDESVTLENTPDSRQLTLARLAGDKLAKFEQVVAKAMDSCNAQCHSEACEHTIVKTYVSPGYKSSEKIAFAIECTSDLIKKVQFVPKLGFFDFITQVASVLSIWIGVSFISLAEILRRNDRDSILLLQFLISRHTAKVKRLTVTLRKMVSFRGKFRRKPRDTGHVMNRRKSRKKIPLLINGLAKICIFILFAWQCKNVFQNYFDFKTTVTVDYEVNPQVTTPSAVLCILMKDIIRFQSSHVTVDNYEQTIHRYNTLTNFTIGDLLTYELTGSVMDGCYLTNFTDRYKQFVYYNETECTNVFNIYKFFYNQEICFALTPNSDDVFTQKDIRFTLFKPGIIYFVSVSPEILNRTNLMHVFVYSGSEIPRFSNQYVTVDTSKSGKVICLANKLHRIRLQPAPYETRCNPKQSGVTCLENCLYASKARLDRLPYSSRCDEDLPLKTLSFTDLLNEKMNQLWLDIESECNSKCNFEACDYNFTTATHEGTIRLNDQRTLFAILSPSFPNTIVTALPVMHFYDFAYQIFCCTSFWLGFSIISLNPITMAANRDSTAIKKSLDRKLTRLSRKIDKLFGFSSNQAGLMSKRWLKSWYQLEKNHLPVYLIATVCCVYHTYYSMSLYLSYSAYIDVFQSPETDTKVCFSLCLDIAELISRKFEPQSLSSELGPSFEQRERVFSNSVDYLLSNAVKEDDIMSGCQFWGLPERRKLLKSMSNVTDRILFESNNETLCNYMHHVDKMLAQSYLCYKFRPEYFTDWTYRQMKNTLMEHRTLVSVRVNYTLLTKRFSIVISPEDRNPITGANFAPVLIKDSRYTRYFIDYTRFASSLLPSPYTNDGFIPFVFDRCLRKCINNHFTKYNLIRVSREVKASQMKIIDQSFKTHRITNFLLNEVQSKCEKQCLDYNEFTTGTINDALTLFTILTSKINVYPGNLSETDGQVSFTLLNTKDPTFIVKFRLKISFFEQLINIGSILSIWFGLSMLQITRRQYNVERQFLIVRSIEEKLKSFADPH